MQVSIIIPTHNPKPEIINTTLAHIRNQSLPQDAYETIIVNNRSSNGVPESIVLASHERLVNEPQLGLTHARLKGFESASADLIIMVDDDNFLDQNYLQEALNFMKIYPNVGAVGGKSNPIFEIHPPEWSKPFWNKLALRDLGNETLISKKPYPEYPAFAPIGAGMVIRKSAITTYITHCKSNTSHITDRSGSELTSGGDNDMVLEILKSGYAVAYHPKLVLQHYINHNRLHFGYFRRLCYGIEKSWVKVLQKHGICPWKSISHHTVMPRKIKNYFTQKAYLSKIQYLRWIEICGRFDGLSE